MTAVAAAGRVACLSATRLARPRVLVSCGRDADGYRSRLRGASGDATRTRPDYAYQEHMPSDSDDEDLGQVTASLHLRTSRVQLTHLHHVKVHQPALQDRKHHTSQVRKMPGLMCACVCIRQGAGAAGPSAGSSDSGGAPADSEQQQSESDVDDDDAGCGGSDPLNFSAGVQTSESSTCQIWLIVVLPAVGGATYDSDARVL